MIRTFASILSFIAIQIASPLIADECARAIATGHHYGLPERATALGAVDADGDGDLDLVAASASFLTVLLNERDGFHPEWDAKPYQPAGAAPDAQLTTDVNGDGLQDLVLLAPDRIITIVAGRASDPVTTERVRNSVSGATAVAVAGDLTGDGQADLVIAGSADRRTIAVYRGNGDGSFTRLEQALVRDRHVQALAIAERTGAGDGIFTAPVDGSAADQGVMADLDGDGFADYALADNFVSIHRGRGDGTFGFPRSVRAGVNMNAFAAADLNHDGRADAIAADGKIVEIFLTRPDGTQYPVARETFRGAPLVADFNGDSHPDLFNGVELLLGRGDGTVQPVTITEGLPLKPLVAADFNRDGFTDVAGFGFPQDCLWLGPIDAGTRPVCSPAIGQTSSAAVADVNGDRYPDLLVTVFIRFMFPPELYVKLGGPDHPVQRWDFVRKLASSVVSADFDGDGHADAAVAQGDDAGADAIGILRGRGDGTFVEWRRIPLPSYQPAGDIDLTTGDFDGDGRPDLGATAGAPGEYWFYLQERPGVFSTSSSGATLRDFTAVATGDVDRNGMDDLLVLGYNQITVYAGQCRDGDDAPGPAVALYAATPSTLVVNVDADDGELVLYDEQKPIATTEVIAGRGVFTHALPAGSYRFYAVYSGDGSKPRRISNVVAVEVPHPAPGKRQRGVRR